MCMCYHLQLDELERLTVLATFGILGILSFCRFPDKSRKLKQNEFTHACRQLKAYLENRSSFLFVLSSWNRSTTSLTFGRFRPLTHSLIKNATTLCWLQVFFSADFRDPEDSNISLSFSGVYPSFSKTPANFHWKSGNSSGFECAELVEY